MQRLAITGAERGRRQRAEIADDLATYLLDPVLWNCAAAGPSWRWVTDAVLPSPYAEFVHAALVIVALSRRITGCRASRSQEAI
jgi:hypothetical protein